MKAIFLVFKEVFGKKRYIFLFFLTALIFLAMIVFIPNVKLLWQLFIGSIQTNFTPLNAFFAFLISILFGIYLVLFIFFFEKRRGLVRSGKAGFFASVIGAMGVGCSSYGAVVLSMFLSTAGAASVVALLPLRGSEFAILSIIFLLFSIYHLTRNIILANICKIK